MKKEHVIPYLDREEIYVPYLLTRVVPRFLGFRCKVSNNQ